MSDQITEESEHFTKEELSEIYAKHRALRGSNRLKYPAKESRCRNQCGIFEHDVVMGLDKKRLVVRRRQQHGCFLSLAHEGYCEFSSECGEQTRSREELVA